MIICFHWVIDRLFFLCVFWIGNGEDLQKFIKIKIGTDNSILKLYIKLYVSQTINIKIKCVALRLLHSVKVTKFAP